MDITELSPYPSTICVVYLLSRLSLRFCLILHLATVSSSNNETSCPGNRNNLLVSTKRRRKQFTFKYLSLPLEATRSGIGSLKTLHFMMRHKMLYLHWHRICIVMNLKLATVHFAQHALILILYLLVISFLDERKMMPCCN